MNITIPASVYGDCNFFLPPEMGKWFKSNRLKYPTRVFTTSTGDGTNGKGMSNIKYHYIAYHTTKEDALAFKLMFPYCDVK